MTTPLLTTKLYIPPIRPKLVPRPRLIERLNAGLHRKLTLISASTTAHQTQSTPSSLAQLTRSISLSEVEPWACLASSVEKAVVSDNSSEASAMDLGGL